jgi:hypothetical protein
MRSVAFKGYVIFMRYVDDANLEIVHILEGHRDIGLFRATPKYLISQNNARSRSGT